MTLKRKTVSEYKEIYVGKYTTLKEWKEAISELISLYGEDVTLEYSTYGCYDDYYGEGEVVFSIRYERPETDAEFAKRRAKSDKARAAAKARKEKAKKAAEEKAKKVEAEERALFETLKQKYG